MTEISSVPDTPATKDRNFELLTELVGYLVETHHAFTRSELARLFTLADRAATSHGGEHPELAHVQELVVALADDLLPHLEREERVLFPYIVALEAARSDGALPVAPFGTVARPVRVMRAEHERADEILGELRRVTGHYSMRPGIPGSYRALYEGLAALDRDLVDHMHLENDVLFPRAESIEALLRGIA